MTLDKLNMYRALQKDIELDLQRKRLLEIEAYAAGASQIGGMPSSHEPHSRTEQYAIRLAELSKKLQEDIYRKIEIEIEIRTFFEAQEAPMRLILKMRFEKGYSWSRVALEAGMSAEAVKKAVYRMIRKYRKTY